MLLSVCAWPVARLGWTTCGRFGALWGAALGCAGRTVGRTVGAAGARRCACCEAGAADCSGSKAVRAARASRSRRFLRDEDDEIAQAITPMTMSSSIIDRSSVRYLSAGSPALRGSGAVPREMALRISVSEMTFCML